MCESSKAHKLAVIADETWPTSTPAVNSSHLLNSNSVLAKFGLSLSILSKYLLSGCSRKFQLIDTFI